MKNISSSSIQPITQKGNGKSYWSRKFLQFGQSSWLAKHLPPNIVQQISGDMPISVKQCSISSEAMEEINNPIGCLLEASILNTWQSVWNTPCCPSKRLELKTIDQCKIWGTWTNWQKPFIWLSQISIFLSLLPPEHEIHTVLDAGGLGDVLLHSPVKIKSAHLCIEWAKPKIGILAQLTWTRLPQAFNNSLTNFNEELNQNWSLL